MSAQFLALAGVVIGALLAGAGNLLLAWRDETIQARTGVYLILKILQEALEEVARLRGKPKPRWNPEQLPDSKLWDQYRAAVSGRLALARLRKIDMAMRRLDHLNAAAARAGEERAERNKRILDAAVAGEPQAVREFEAAPDPELLDEAAVGYLEPTQHDLEAARNALIKVTPTGLPGRTRNLRSFKPWFLWHWRSFAAALVAVVLIGTVAWLSTSTGPSAASEVQDALASHFGDPAFTGCEPVQDHEGDFACVVVETAEPTSCEARVAASPQESGALFVRNESEAPAKQSCGLITQALEYNAQKRAEADCIAFFEAGISNVPTGVAPSSPGFMQRMKARLRREAHTAEGVPPVIVPGSAFTADC